MFLRMPAPAAGATEARTEWFSVNAEELATVTGQQSLGLGATDPTQTLEYLRGASSRIDEVGREPVGDVDATHYRATVDLGRSVEPTPGGRRSLVKAAVEQFRSQFGTTEFAVDVWTDDAGLPRRFRFELDLADYDRSGRVPEGAIMSFTMELFDYGEPVDIASPPADQVGDLTALLQRLGLPE